MIERALVLFSGGQDSAVCLAWALKTFSYVETVSFDYNQRHSIELECGEKYRREIKSKSFGFSEVLGPDHRVSIPEFGRLSDTALTKDRTIETPTNGLPNTFVPGRNLLFLTYASAIAYREGHRHIVGGMCETDYSGYPDCRKETIKALEVAINLGMESGFEFHTPLMSMTKAETWSLADRIGGKTLVDMIIEETHTCYLGIRGERHGWGYGCGCCPACELRKQGWLEFIG